MDERDYKAMNDEVKKEENNTVCCDVLERLRINWFLLDNKSRCLPYIYGNSDTNMYRINNCPSCGKYIRDIILPPK